MFRKYVSWKKQHLIKDTVSFWLENEEIIGKN
jgi:hypothetical protein